LWETSCFISTLPDGKIAGNSTPLIGLVCGSWNRALPASATRPTEAELTFERGVFLRFCTIRYRQKPVAIKSIPIKKPITDIRKISESDSVVFLL
jgi:hypothetical protein